jgi:Ulp1 protease family, C-terminal catalytic domain
LQIFVPRQQNGFDCGLFVCRYILGIYKLREQTFMFEDVYKNKTPLLKKVTNSSSFIFNQKLVNDFRKQLGELFDNLDHLYHHGKVPKPSGRGKTSSRGREVSVGMKTVIGLDSTVTPQQKDIDSAKEREYASPILDEI